MAKSKKNRYTFYRTLRLNRLSEISYEFILDNFNCECEWLKNKGNVLIGFEVEKHEKLIESIINNGWNLVSVSEDDKSICYHFTKIENID